MRGEFIGVWLETWQEIWVPLVVEPLGEVEEAVPADIFCELYRELAKSLRSPPSIEELADIIDDPIQSCDAFESIKAEDLAGEWALVQFLESAHEVFEDLGGDELTNRYFNLLAAFVEKFSLRYDLRRPCTLCPTLPGVFSSLVYDLRTLTAQDGHLDQLMKDFEESVRDLRRIDCSERRIKTCIQKQVNLLEALGRTNPCVTQRGLGGIANQIGSWPHGEVRAALKSLHTFTCDYPGIRHCGTPDHVLREIIDMRDMVAISILLTGFTPYLINGLNPDAIFGGGGAQGGQISAAVPVSTRIRPIGRNYSARARLTRIRGGFSGYFRGRRI